jgi:hypothetical protein
MRSLNELGKTRNLYLTLKKKKKKIREGRFIFFQ